MNREINNIPKVSEEKILLNHSEIKTAIQESNEAKNKGIKTWKLEF